MSYIIETNIPLPVRASKDESPFSTLRQMSVGQSVVIKAGSVSSIYAFKATPEGKTRKFTISSLPEYAPPKHVRVWLKEVMAEGAAA